MKKNDERVAARPLRVGFVGPGKHAEDNLLPSLSLQPGVMLSAVCSRSEERAMKAASRWKASSWTTDWESITDVKLVDALIVSATPELHFAVAAAAIIKKIPIFVEKPPAENTETLRMLCDAAATHESLAFVGYNLIYTRPMSDFVRLIEDFGGSYSIKIKCLANKPRNLMWGCNSILDSFLLAVGVHALSVSDYLCSDLEHEYS